MGAAELARTLGAQPLLRLRLLRLAREEAERRIAGGGSRSRAAKGDAGGATQVADAAGRPEGAMSPGTARMTSVVSSEDESVVFEVGVEIPCGVNRRGGNR